MCALMEAMAAAVAAKMWKCNAYIARAFCTLQRYNCVHIHNTNMRTRHTRHTHRGTVARIKLQFYVYKCTHSLPAWAHAGGVFRDWPGGLLASLSLSPSRPTCAIIVEWVFRWVAEDIVLACAHVRVWIVHTDALPDDSDNASSYMHQCAMRNGSVEWSPVV